MRAFMDHVDTSHYGLDLIKRSGVSSGALYPILAKMEVDGLVAGHWENIDESAERRRKRKYYELTSDGRIVIEQTLAKVVDELSLPTEDRGRRRRRLPGLA
ncbi:MAG TPA: helix-turn-helix transcriptional regulator [Mycobacteriales bacterium]|nr:helix-turn-helix transcriptional regulator [Mycobacteriales bacterium]